MVATRLQCGFTGCEYVSESESEQVALLQFQSHMASHQQAPQARPASTKQKLPAIVRPKLKQDITEEEWETFKQEWKRFRRCTEIPIGQEADQLFDCCEQGLGRLLLKEDASIIEAGEEPLMVAMKAMAVIKVATSVRRTKLLSLKQDHGQNFREFYANVKAQASTCNFSVECGRGCCNNAPPIDYTPLVVKDILVSGILDPDNRKDVLEWPELDSKSAKDLVGFVEGKETSKKAWKNEPSDAAAMSSYKKSGKQDDHETSKKLALKGRCTKCGIQIALYTRGRSGKFNRTPYKLCLKCHKAEISSDDHSSSTDGDKKQSEASAIHGFISAIALQDMEKEETTSTDTVVPAGAGVPLSVTKTSSSIAALQERRIVLDHHIFHQ